MNDVLESGLIPLQDGTAHLWEEGSHFHGAFVHSMNASCFCVWSMDF